MATYYYPIYIFMQEFAAYGLVDVTGDTPPYTLTFLPGTSQANQTLVQNAANAWDWTPLTPIPDNVPTPPNFNSAAFLAACLADTSGNLSAEAKANIMNVSLLLINFSSNPGAITQWWSAAVAAASANAPTFQWLTTAAQNTILGYATTYGVPLT